MYPPHTKFKAEVYVLSKEEGGRHTPFFANNLANTLRALGKPADAEPYYHQALTLYQGIPNTEEQQANFIEVGF